MNSYLIVKNKKIGFIVEKVEIKQVSGAEDLSNDLVKISALLQKQLEGKYPVEQYEITLTSAAESAEKPLFTMIASSRSLLTGNISGVIIGIFLLLLLLLFRSLFTLAFFIIGIIILIIYMTVDYSIWKKKGIRKIEIDDSGLNLYRGANNIIERIEANQITVIDVFTKLNRKIVNIITDGKTDKSIPGVTFFSGSRVRITNDAFDDSVYSGFIERVQQFKK